LKALAAGEDRSRDFDHARGSHAALGAAVDPHRAGGQLRDRWRGAARSAFTNTAFAAVAFTTVAIADASVADASAAESADASARATATAAADSSDAAAARAESTAAASDSVAHTADERGAVVIAISPQPSARGRSDRR
jgi:hypothetical protein